MTQLSIRTCAVVVLLASPAVAGAQQQPTPMPVIKPAGDNPSVTPVRIQVNVARYQGEKRVSSLPYTLFVNPTGPRTLAQVRMGAEIPVTTTPPAGGDNPRPGVPAVNYERIGTEIDCVVRPTGDGRFSLELTISDRTVYAENEAPRPTTNTLNPALRSFRSYNTLVLKDGQTTQFPAAADRMTGEIVRVDVTLDIVK